jgi:TRAP-type C4-dicarboxylate transport system permease small subunit
LLRLVLGSFAGAALFAMMVLTFMDVVGRKFFGHSIGGSVELTELLMLALIFGALPLASLAGEHVIFDLLDALLPERVKRWQSLISNLICTVLVGFTAWFVFNRAIRTQSMGDTTAQLLIPVAPFHYAAALLLAVCALIHLYLALSGRRRG